MKIFILSFFALSICFSCTKENQTAINVNTENSSAIDQSKTSCTANLEDVENIQIFPPDNAWNEDISNQPVDPYSDSIIGQFASSDLHADFGSDSSFGIPYTAVCGSQKKYKVEFEDKPESDGGPYAIPLTAPIEGNGTGDAVVISVDVDNGILYELFGATPDTVNKRWDAYSGAIFNLNSDSLRHKNRIAADASGLPILPGLVRYDELAKGVIDHAIRFTLSRNVVYPKSYIAPATDGAEDVTGKWHYSLPYGARIRLKASVDISSFSASNQIILTALKKYGLILADTGDNMFISGAPDPRWNDDDLSALRSIPASDFEVVKFKSK